MSAAQTGSGSASGSDGAPVTPDPRRRRLVIAAVAVVVVVLVALILVFQNDDETSDGSGTAAAVTSAPTTARDTSVAPSPPTPTPTGPTESVDELPPALAPVPLDAPASVGNGIVATLPQIEEIEGSAVGPGNIAGPALRVTVRIQNGTAGPVSVSGVAVNMYYGADRAPASPLEEPSRRPFGGMVAAGASAEGVYVFSVPSDARDAVTVEVGYEAGAPLLLFTGPVA